MVHRDVIITTIFEIVQSYLSPTSALSVVLGLHHEASSPPNTRGGDLLHLRLHSAEAFFGSINNEGNETETLQKIRDGLVSRIVRFPCSTIFDSLWSMITDENNTSRSWHVVWWLVVTFLTLNTFLSYLFYKLANYNLQYSEQQQQVVNAVDDDNSSKTIFEVMPYPILPPRAWMFGWNFTKAEMNNTSSSGPKEEGGRDHPEGTNDTVIHQASEQLIDPTMIPNVIAKFSFGANILWCILSLMSPLFGIIKMWSLSATTTGDNIDSLSRDVTVILIRYLDQIGTQIWISMALIVCVRRACQFQSNNNNNGKQWNKMCSIGIATCFTIMVLFLDSNNKVPLSPNLNMQWYLFTQTFWQFRSYFHTMMKHIPLLFVTPLTLRLYNYPVELTTSLWLLWTLLKPILTLNDLRLVVPYMLMSPYTLARTTVVSTFALVALPIPLVLYLQFYGMFVTTGVGNPNYLYFQCLVFDTFWMMIVLDYISATLKHDKAIRYTLKKQKKQVDDNISEKTSENEPS